MVPGIAPSAAADIQASGIPAPAGAMLGYSPMGVGNTAAVYSGAPDYVQTAATGPGLFGAIDRDTGTGIGSFVEDRLAGLAAGHLTGNVGSAIGGMAGMALGGPVGGMIGGFAGGFLGGQVGRSIPNSGLVSIPGTPLQGAIATALSDPTIGGATSTSGALGDNVTTSADTGRSLDTGSLGGWG